MESVLPYDDRWDGIVSRFIRQHEPSPGYWTRSEEYALAIVERTLTWKRRHRLLDLGCGRGRLLERFARLFDNVVAVDSNPGAIEEAKRTAEKANLSNVIFVDRPFEECSAEIGQFDVVLCSHVIQHLATFEVADFIQQTESVLANHGWLALLTSHSSQALDAYKIWTVEPEGECVREERLENAEAFDRGFINSYPDYKVPSHAFALSSLRGLLADYRIIKLHCFHSLHKQGWTDNLLFRDRWMNLPGIKGSFGIDVLVICEKRGEH